MGARTLQAVEKALQTALQLGAYACIAALLALTGRELHTRQEGHGSPAVQAGACRGCSAGADASLDPKAAAWIEAPGGPALRRGFPSP